MRSALVDHVIDYDDESDSRSLFSDSNQSGLPAEWSLMNQRLSNVQNMLAKLHKKAIKLSKNIANNSQMEKQSKFHYRKTGSQQLVTHLDRQQIKQNLLTQLRQQLRSVVMKGVHKLQQRTEFLSQQLLNSEGPTEQKLKRRIKDYYTKNRAYIDRAVSEMKSMINEHAKGKTLLDSKLENSCECDQSSQSNFFSASNQKPVARKLQLPIQNNTIIKNSNKKQNLKSTRDNIEKDNNRVSYLKEKLLQFQKINQKYERNPPKGQNQLVNKMQSDSSTKAIEKMKDFKDFLEQSESQIEPSNLLQFQSQLPVKVDPIPSKWKSLQNFVNKDKRH